ncbi:alpha-S2-casein-like [Pan troglodytes]|uniref:alpha-S2-casein-like n=1 Tax=Pan troglodytes TaxID=9598 RepID=UPI0023F57EC5|nr:alpha-S2-casein-like [Pan troglodytes]
MNNELTKEERIYLKHMNKINQYYPELSFPQHLQASHQPQIVMNPGNQIKTITYPNSPIPESTSISQEESAEVFPETKTNQFLQKFTVPQYVQAVPLVVYQPVESHSGKHLPIYSHLEEQVRFLN